MLPIIRLLCHILALAMQTPVTLVGLIHQISYYSSSNNWVAGL
jgi:hypothetical protein